MKLIVTTSSRMAFGMDRIGVMVIVHRSGEPMPVELLEDLDVIFWLGDCDKNAAVLKLLNSRGVTVRAFKCWCDCEQILTSLVAPCGESFGEAA